MESRAHPIQDLSTDSKALRKAWLSKARHRGSVKMLRTRSAARIRKASPASTSLLGRLISPCPGAIPLFVWKYRPCALRLSQRLVLRRKKWYACSQRQDRIGRFALATVNFKISGKQ